VSAVSSPHAVDERRRAERLARGALAAFLKPVGGDPYPRVVPPPSFYWLVLACPTCGRRVRGSSLLRHWDVLPRPSFDDSEVMLTRGGGFGRIANERAGLWDVLRQADVRTSVQLGSQVERLLDQLDIRQRSGAVIAGAAASRARRGR